MLAPLQRLSAPETSGMVEGKRNWKSPQRLSNWQLSPEDEKSVHRKFESWIPWFASRDWGQVPKTPNWQSGPVVLFWSIPGCKPAGIAKAGVAEMPSRPVMPLTAAAIPWGSSAGSAFA